MKTNATYISTFDAITSLVARLGSQRAAAKFLGVPPATISDILRQRVGHMTRERENEIRASLALPPLPPMVTIESCPDCNGVHHGRCNGKPVAIKPVRGKREPKYWAEYDPVDLGAAIRNRVPY